jgi:translation initiation factor 6
VGNTRGLLLPNNTTDQEMMHIRNTLPESVAVQRVEERLSGEKNVFCWFFFSDGPSSAGECDCV